MQEIITKDNSPTIMSLEYSEPYRSISGAMEESFKKFIGPCRIKEFKDEVSILDIGFGLGYNVCAAVDAVLEANPKCNLVVFSLEKDKEILKKLQNLNPAFKNYNMIKGLAKNLEYRKGNINLKIILGNATETIKKINTDFDAVFLDPFSPPKNPELWTEEFLNEVAKRMKKSGILATYSCARIVRENMKKAGLMPEDGPSVGRRAPSTIARKAL